MTIVVFSILEAITTAYLTYEYSIGGFYLYFLLGLDAIFIFGAIYLLTAKRQGAALALVCSIVEIIGRIFIVNSTIYPFSGTLETSVMLFAGIIIAGITILYIWTQWNSFSEEFT